jgi:hypothetical protein
MDGKARTAKWRARQVAVGGKPIGVTLTPQAAMALEALQSNFSWSQREAISMALELAAGHPELFEDARRLAQRARTPFDGFRPGRMEELEQRLQQLEALLANSRIQPGEPSAEDQARENKEKLLAFTASQMKEHGERMSRVHLYALAKEHNMPVPPTQHEYNVFISYHMDVIREIMRSLKERTH